MENFQRGTEKSKVSGASQKKVFGGNKMKCHKCNKQMKYVKGMKFNEYTIDGWKCSCGEIYYNPEQAQKILVLVFNWACTSSPMTGSNSICDPLKIGYI